MSVLHHLAHHTACRTLGVSQRQRAGCVCARVLLLRERELTGPRPSSYLSDNLRPFRPPEMAQVGPAPNPAPQPRSTQLSLELADPAVAHGQSFIRVAAESAFKFAWKFLEWVPVANAPDVRVDRAAFEAALMPALTPSSGYAQRLGRQGSPNFTSFIETEFLPDALASFATELRDAKAFDKACDSLPEWHATLARTRTTALAQNPNALEFDDSHVEVTAPFNVPGRAGDGPVELSPFHALSLADLVPDHSQPLPGLPLSTATLLLGARSARLARDEISSTVRTGAELILAKQQATLQLASGCSSALRAISLPTHGRDHLGGSTRPIQARLAVVHATQTMAPPLSPNYPSLTLP